MGLFSVVMMLFGCADKTANGQSTPPPPTVAKQHVSFEQQLEIFKRLGFKLNEGTSLSDVDRWGGKSEFESPRFVTLYQTLGQTIEREPWTPLTNRVWDFDVEAIEDHGAYVDIVKNLERIARGEIKFDNVKDYVDIEERTAWVSFTLRGKRYKWNLTVDDDWADPGLFSKVVELTRSLNTKGRYTYFNTGGQNAVIGYETPKSLEAIKKATGLKIEWLN